MVLQWSHETTKCSSPTKRTGARRGAEKRLRLSGLCVLGRATRQGKSVDLEDIKFHQCVRLARFENDRTISFIPPDGAFELMTYRLATVVKPLLWVDCHVERHSATRVEYIVKARSQFKERSNATGVQITLPVPADAIAPQVRAAPSALPQKRARRPLELSRLELERSLASNRRSPPVPPSPRHTRERVERAGVAHGARRCDARRAARTTRRRARRWCGR